MKRIQFMMLFVAVFCLLTGCSTDAKKYEKNTLVVNGNGSLIEVAVENFKDSSVTAKDLETYIDQQIDDYNGDNGKMVKKSFMDTDDMSKVKLVLTYKNIDSFNEFNLLKCTLDDYTDIKNEKLKGDFTSADGKRVKSTDFTNTEDAYVFILSEATDVVVKGDILYYNDAVKVEDGIATTSGKDDAVIIFK